METYLLQVWTVIGWQWIEAGNLAEISALLGAYERDRPREKFRIVEHKLYRPELGR